MNGLLSRRCKEGEVVMLIVERSVDTVTPLLHCMTLQGMVNDVLPVESGCFQVRELLFASSAESFLTGRP